MSLHAVVAPRPVSGDQVAMATASARNQNPTGLRRAVRAALARDAYAVVPVGATALRAANPANRLFTTFHLGRVELAASGPDPWDVGIRLEAFGPGGSLSAVPPAPPVAAGGGVEYRHAGVVEWYRNDARGLEQGFTLAAPPAGPRPGEPVVLRLGVLGQLRPAMDGSGVVLAAAGGPVVGYGGLVAYDADRRPLPARLAVDGGAIVVTVDPAGARYPIVVDPVFSQQAKLTASDGKSNDAFGTSVAISGDTAVVGNNDGAGPKGGAAYVFVRTGFTWTQQAKLTAPDGAAANGFGSQVAISGDTVVVGAVFGDYLGVNSGSAYVFLRSGSTWSQQAKLDLPEGAANEYFGGAVAIDGDTIAIGAANASLGNGAVIVFVRSGTTWAREARINSPLPGANLGNAVAISGDRVLAGADFANAPASGSGAAIVLVRGGSGWSIEATLVAPDGAASDYFGNGVALAGDTAVVGASRDDTGAGFDSGSAHVFVRSGGTWAHEATLTAPDAARGDGFGYSVAVTGVTALVGAPFDDEGGRANGSVWVFRRNASTWSEFGKRVASDPPISFGEYGASVAVSGDWAVVGAIRLPDRVGAAYVLATLPTVSITPGVLDFGAQPPSSPAPAKSLSVTNTGASPVLVLSISVGGTGSGDFAVTSNACNLPLPVVGQILPVPAVLVPGQSCIIGLTFTPRAIGNRTATLRVGHTGTEEVATASLTGTGREPTTSTTSPPTTTASMTGSRSTTTTTTGGATALASGLVNPGGNPGSADFAGTTAASRSGTNLSRTGFGAAPLVAWGLLLIDTGALAVFLAGRRCPWPPWGRSQSLPYG